MSKCILFYDYFLYNKVTSASKFLAAVTSDTRSCAAACSRSSSSVNIKRKVRGMCTKIVAR